jgi:Leucine-rich repeat (LRR) protein
MFIKKDTRKIPEILTDEADKRDYLKLSKRAAEFQGSTRLLFKESNLQSFMNLKSLNLYDNDLSSIQGVGILSHSPVTEISFGMNKLTSLPLELGLLSTLTSVWLDDNLLEQFPICLCQLQNLTALRMSGNSISEIPSSFAALENLEILAFDNNGLTEIPPCIWSLVKLRELWLRFVLMLLYTYYM